MDEPQQQNKRHTRLRDFGDFRSDVATLATHKMASVTTGSRQSRRMDTPLPPSLEEEEQMSIAFSPVSHEPLWTPASSHAVTIIQFPTPVTSSIRQSEPETIPLQAVAQQPVAIQKVKRKKWLSVAARVGITVLLFIFLFKSLSWSTLLQSITHVHSGKMLIGLVVGAFSIVISAYQWRSLLRAERIQYDLANLIDLYLVGIAFSHFLPTGMGGDVVKAVHVGRESNNSAGSASAALMSRITGFFGMMIVALPVLLIWHSQFNAGVTGWFLLLSLLVGGMLVGTIAAAAVLPEFNKGRWANTRVFTSAIKIGNALKSTTKRPVAMGIATLFGLEFWIIGCLNYYAYGIALGLHVPLYFYCVAIPFISLITFLPISINGFGVREGAFVFIFSTIGVPSASALALALFMDAQVLLFGAIGSCIYLTMGKQKNATQKTYCRHIA